MLRHEITSCAESGLECGCSGSHSEHPTLRFYDENGDAVRNGVGSLGMVLKGWTRAKIEAFAGPYGEYLEYKLIRAQLEQAQAEKQALEAEHQAAEELAHMLATAESLVPVAIGLGCVSYVPACLAQRI